MDVLLPVPSERRIATLHDVCTLTVPRSYAWHSRLLFRKSGRQVRDADAIITVSNFSKQKIVELLNVHPDKVTVVYGGVSSKFRRIEDSQRIRKTCVKYGVPHEYFLFVGVFNRRKNLRSLLRAYRLYRSRHPRNHALLVFCGRPGIGSQEFYRDISKLDLSKDVKILQGASDTDLAELFSGSRALVFPSIGEGFGLPVVEAMACGAPVICGNRCAMSEVAGGAALCIDPTDIEQIADAMERVMCDTGMVQSLRAGGLERAKQFSWTRTAQETLALYQRLL
jgi:glycosyltransferase involved in cell wall biosynthesis